MKCGGRFYQRSLTILTELLISYFHACPVGAVKINEYRIPTSKSEPMAITSDPDGALWFTEGYGNKIGQVVIASAPSAPTPGIGQATVSFSALASSGGSAITGYTVTSNPTGGNDTDAGSTSLTHIVTELASGTTYSFTVTATNAVGTSTSLPSKTITPATVPGAPTIGIVTAGNRQASVNFTPVSTQTTAEVL